MKKTFNKNYMRSYLILGLLVFASCSRLLVEPDPSGTAEKNFEVFWNDVYNTYPFFNYDKVDWKQMYADNRPRVSSKTTDNELFGIFQDMMTPLLDGHKSLQSTSNHYYWPINISAADYSEIPRLYYLSEVHTMSAPEVGKNVPQPVCTFGFISNTSILYFYINSYFTEYKFDRLLDSINKAHPVTGLVLDVRNNGGGYLGTMWNLMGMFTDSELKYAYNKEKTGPLEDNFGPYRYFSLPPNSSYNFPASVKVILLTSRHCFSATEHSVLISSLLPNVKTLGDTTGGALSPIIERTLPNGMNYTLVSSITVDTDYKLYEHIGIPPEVPVATTPQDFEGTTDPDLDKALELLK